MREFFENIGTGMLAIIVVILAVAVAISPFLAFGLFQEGYKTIAIIIWIITVPTICWYIGRDLNN